MATKTSSKPRSITIEFLETGLIAWNNIWQAGQRKTIVKDSKDWLITINRRGEDSWLTLGPDGQRKRWGKVYFKRVANVDLNTEETSDSQDD